MYPSFLQLAGQVGTHLDRLVAAHRDSGSALHLSRGGEFSLPSIADGEHNQKKCSYAGDLPHAHHHRPAPARSPWNSLPRWHRR
ncbi:hypothetical protein CNECB9_210005 [Cupriavidus necator]|uniref:Uncharacterized protein n=1 Tax=Cupriavidus necator TaxID=106590 RepID=A0A1K0IC51_CUPNE|nr:hypothetical protein CNECB9_210005 [Cupriavidus necator]